MTVFDYLTALKAAGEKASGVTFNLDETERRKAIELALDHSAPRIVAAWQLFQREKTGKPFRFFVQDLAQFLPRIREGDAQRANLPSIFTDCPICGTTYQKLRRAGCPYCEEHRERVARASSAEDVQEAIS